MVHSGCHDSLMSRLCLLLSMLSPMVAFSPVALIGGGMHPRLRHHAIFGGMGCFGRRKESCSLLSRRHPHKTMTCSEEGSDGLSTSQSKRRPGVWPSALASTPIWANVASAMAHVPRDAVAAAHLLSEAATASVTADALIGGMLAGAVAGACVDLALYPIDTVKTRLQTLGSIQLEASEWRQLYSGLFGGLAGHVPSSALFFAVYETSRVLYLEPALGIGSAQSQLLASALGNIAASTIRVPTEVVKTRMQSGAEASMKECVVRILERDGPGGGSMYRSINGMAGFPPHAHFAASRNHAAFRISCDKHWFLVSQLNQMHVVTPGLAGLFRGYGAFLLRDLPFDAIEFVTYEQLKLAYRALAGAGAAAGWLGGLETAFVGALAGGITGALTTPLDTVRARQMNEAGEGTKRDESILSTASKIVNEGGWQGLFAGVKPRALWLSLGGTVFFSSLEAAKQVFMP